MTTQPSLLEMLAELKTVLLEKEATQGKHVMVILADNKDALSGIQKGDGRYEFLLQSVDKRVFDKAIDMLKHNMCVGVSQFGPLVGIAFLDLTKVGTGDTGVAMDIKVTPFTDAQLVYSEVEAAIMRFDINKRKLLEHT